MTFILDERYGANRTMQHTRCKLHWCAIGDINDIAFGGCHSGRRHYWKNSSPDSWNSSKPCSIISILFCDDHFDSLYYLINLLSEVSNLPIMTHESWHKLWNFYVKKIIWTHSFVWIKVISQYQNMIQILGILHLSLIVASLRTEQLNECCTELILQKTTEQGPTDPFLSRFVRRPK